MKIIWFQHSDFWRIRIRPDGRVDTLTPKVKIHPSEETAIAAMLEALPRNTNHRTNLQEYLNGYRAAYFDIPKTLQPIRLPHYTLHSRGGNRWLITARSGGRWRRYMDLESGYSDVVERLVRMQAYIDLDESQGFSLARHLEICSSLVARIEAEALRPSEALRELGSLQRDRRPQ